MFELKAAEKDAQEKKSALALPMAAVQEAVDNLRDQMIKEALAPRP